MDSLNSGSIIILSSCFNFVHLCNLCKIMRPCVRRKLAAVTPVMWPVFLIKFVAFDFPYRTCWKPGSPIHCNFQFCRCRTSLAHCWRRQYVSVDRFITAMHQSICPLFWNLKVSGVVYISIEETISSLLPWHATNSWKPAFGYLLVYGFAAH